MACPLIRIWNRSCGDFCPRLSAPDSAMEMISRLFARLGIHHQISHTILRLESFKDTAHGARGNSRGVSSNTPSPIKLAKLPIPRPLTTACHRARSSPRPLPAPFPSKRALQSPTTSSNMIALNVLDAVHSCQHPLITSKYQSGQTLRDST